MVDTVSQYSQQNIQLRNERILATQLKQKFTGKRAEM